jgi:hypothetical protein
MMKMKTSKGMIQGYNGLETRLTNYFCNGDIENSILLFTTNMKKIQYE